jgi:protease IV
MDDDDMTTARSGRSPLRMIVLFLLVIVFPLALGLFFAPRLIPKPKIGIVRLNYDILGETAYLVTEQLRYARNDPAVKAVVLVINSPGGSAAYSEELYLDVLGTRQEMPVVASVDLMAASGAYYMAAAADEIYAKPTSNVGSIGVIAFLPGSVFIEQDLLTTGPYKAFGGTRDSSMRQIEMAKYTFLEAIKAGRGERLKADLDFLSRAELFTGVQAQELGLIDGVLSGNDVFQRAAELAGLADYEVVDLMPLTFPELFGEAIVNRPGAYQPEPVNAQALWTLPQDLPAGIYYRYIDPYADR